MNYDELRMRHFGEFAELYLRETALDEADVSPAVMLFILAVPIGKDRAALGGRLRQGVIVARSEHIADRPVRVGLEIALHSVVLLYRIVPGKSKALRGKCSLQHPAAVFSNTHTGSAVHGKNSSVRSCSCPCSNICIVHTPDL